MNIEERKKALRFQFEKVVDPLGYKFSPDEAIVNELLEAEAGIEQRRGVPYCPCQGTTRNWAEDMMIVCPCIPFHKEHFDAMKRCWCGLYVHKDVTDPSVLKQIPVNEIGR